MCVVLPTASADPTRLSGLLGAIVWNLITWLFGLPTSSSHALFGGYAGAAVTKAGFGALIVTNLFGWRATDPDDMKAARDPVGRGNDSAILEVARTSAIVVCAWGNHGAHLGRSRKVLEFLREEKLPLHTLRLNGNGEPAHPLYLPARLEPVPFQ